jgi:hypothetical protein
MVKRTVGLGSSKGYDLVLFSYLAFDGARYRLVSVREGAMLHELCEPLGRL